ncbi:MAG: DUF3021 domain-containing protein [Clostridiales bacterium]|nr:DUF3021 domain-containing protein [Clostridiales bacterium]
MKNLLKDTLIGIGIACIIFTVFGTIFDVANKGTFSMEHYMFTKQALGAVIVGIGFSLPSGIYRSDKLPFALQVLFHMGIGCAIYIITAFKVGWIPSAFGWGGCFLFLAAELLIAFLIWLGFAFHYRKLAQSMNEKIQGKDFSH